MRVCFTNLGCKLNQAELESISRDFARAGHEVVARLEEADLHVVNTCTVTHMAARTSRKTARRGRRVRPGLRTVLTGCYASEKPSEAAGLKGVDLVVTNDRKEHLLDLVHARFPDDVPAANDLDGGPLPTPYVPLAFGNTRALVKVEDGCNMRCAFCIIPSTRGRQRSRPIPEVVSEVDALVRAGAREVVITGVQISHYQWRRQRLVDLVDAVLEGTDVPRLRLTSIAPWAFDERLFELLAGERLCRHVHMSLQSGCTETLRRMRRPYTAAAYAELVERIRRAVPGVAITTDVIAGFPGETDAEFEQSLAFVDEIGFSKVHAFPYSVREGTEAAELPDPVPYEVKRERMGRLLELSGDLERRFGRSQVGETLEVLWEERAGDGVWRGTSDNYVRIETRSPADLTNTLSRVHVTGWDEDEEGGGAVGELAAVPPAAARTGPRFPILAS